MEKLRELKEKDKLTIFKINGLAMTSKYEVAFHSIQGDRLILKMPRKRKMYAYNISDLSIVFKGHKLPILADSDGNVMRGNACLNLVSDLPKENVRQYIEENNLVEMSEKDKAHAMYMTFEQAQDSQHNLKIHNCIYPEATHSSALVDSIRAKK